MSFGATLGPSGEDALFLWPTGADATLDGARKAYLADLAGVPLLIDDLGMRRVLHTAAEDLLEISMRRYERASTLLTSNRRVDTGQATQRHCRRDGFARSAAAPRARAQMRAA
jgi:hypothetical protein